MAPFLEHSVFKALAVIMAGQPSGQYDSYVSLIMIPISIALSQTPAELHEEIWQDYSNGDLTRQTGKRQAEDIMNR